MGLLDKAKKVLQSNSSSSSDSSKNSSSLLKKAESFRKESDADSATMENTDLDWLDDQSTSNETDAWDQLPNPDGEEEFDLSDIPELDDLDPFSDFSPEVEAEAEDDKPTQELKKDPFEDWQNSFEDDLIDREEDAPLPEVNLFDEWEKDAKLEATKQPFRPESEDPTPRGEEILFDDESDFGTAPMSYHLASKKRIENYQAIFEITKEISASKNFADFFENLAFSIIGQVGCKNVVVFVANKNGSCDALAAQGIKLKPTWSFSEKDDLVHRVSDAYTVIYSDELRRAKISKKEISILDEMGSELIVPIRNKDSFFGFLSLAKLINGEEYIVDDLEFTKIIGEIAGSVFERVSEFERLQDQFQNQSEELQTTNSILKIAKEFASVRKLDEAYDLFTETIKKQLGVKQFSFFLFDSEAKSDYVVFASNFILPDRTKDIRFGKDSDIVGMVSNVSGVYRLERFREDSELKSIFTNDELGIMEEFTILPIINLNWLVGMIIIHSSDKEWTDRNKHIAVSLLETSAPVFANLLILQEKEALYRNPFNPLEVKILAEIEIAQKTKSQFTVCLFKVQNVTRMIHLAGNSVFARYADTLRKTIMDHLSDVDFFTRVGQGKFAIVLHGKDKEESEIVIRKIKSAFSKREEDIVGTFRASYRVLNLSFPKDTKDKSQFLEMVEDA